MRIWFFSFALLAACGGASTAGLFDGDGGPTTGDGAPSTNTNTGTTVDAGAPSVTLDASPAPSSSLDAGHPANPTPDAGGSTPSTTPEAGAPASSDDCPNTAAYSYEFSNEAISAPLCGPTHGGPCADPSLFCCYFDGVSNSHVCLQWLDGGQ